MPSRHGRPSTKPQPAPGALSRRQALRRLAEFGTLAVPLGIGACRSGDGYPDAGLPAPLVPEPSPPAAAPNERVARLQATLRNAVPPPVTNEPITVTQGSEESADPSIGAGAEIYPAPRGQLNPNPLSLATLPEVWGYRRETWGEGAISYIGSAEGNDSWYVPLAWWHRAATLSAFSTCGLHFVCDGRAFEVLFAGSRPLVTLFADGKFMAPQYIDHALYGGVQDTPLAAANAYVRFDFGYAAPRRISLYASSSQGPCAIAIGRDKRLEPWDRSGEPSFCVLTDSYGQAPGVNWPLGGPFWEAATLLGIPHLDLNAIGGTGFAPNPSNADTRLPGNAFGARVASGAATAPDLFLTAGGINDNNFFADPPFYDSPEAAKAGFEAAVGAYFADLRAALPDSVLAAMGPWAPVESIPVNPIAQSKADAILAGLRAIGGPWVFVDNLNGGWRNSAGALVSPTGRGWQTGTGNVTNPKGDGNADLYVAGDGVHPTPAGCLYLGQVLAASLRDAILAL